MISAIVFAPDAWRARADAGDVVARGLPWLVSAVVSGVVRDVTLAASRSMALTNLADHVGCALVEADDVVARFRGGLESAKCNKVVMLLAGYQPIGRFTDELEAHDRLAADRPAALFAVPSGFTQRLMPSRSPVVGIFAPKELARAAGSFDRLARSVRRGPSFATRAQPVA